MPWQQHAVDVALELDPETGELWFEEVIITVPRQSGKTTLILALLVWRCIAMTGRLGAPQTCTYLAQSGKMARRKLEREFARIMRRSRTLREIPQLSRQRPHAANEWKLSMNNGSEHIMFGTESLLQIEAPTDKGSHGDVLDMPVIDEAFAREDDAVEQAVDAATVTRRSPQLYVVSTAGNEDSLFLARKVLAGRKAIGDPMSKTCYLEWSVPDDEQWDDPEVWARYLPALGHTITVDRLMARLDKAQRNPDEVDEEGFEPGVAGFQRGYLNRWPRFPVFGEETTVGSIPNWPLLVDEASKIAANQQWALAVSPDRKWASLGKAGRTSEGKVHVEWMEHRAGTGWVVDKVLEYYALKPVPLRVHKSGPEGAFIGPLREAGVEVVEVSSAEVAQATGQLIDAAANGQLVHLGQPSLDKAVRGALQRVGTDGAAVWSQVKSTVEITPLQAVTVALGGVPGEAECDFFAY